MKPSLHTKRGYTLVEMVIYLAVLTLFSVTIIAAILSFTKSYRTLLALRMLDNTAVDAMERMTRDIRSGSTVDITNSTLGSTPGVLVIIATANSISTTTKFYLQSGVLKVDVNGTYSGPLSLASSTVSNLTFTRITNSISTGVKVDMTVQTTVGPITETKSYHTTVVLRNS